MSGKAEWADKWRFGHGLATGLLLLTLAPADAAIRLKQQDPGALAAPDTMAVAPESARPVAIGCG